MHLMKVSGTYLGLFVIVLFGYVRADLKPIVSPTESNCSSHGSYLYGTCVCFLGYEGLLCQYNTYSMAKQVCEVSYDCYNCDEYACSLSQRQPLTVCDSVSGDYKVNDMCRNITVVCYTNYDCHCPKGLALLGSDCFRKELLDRFGFFMIVTAVLTVFSVGFEILIHFLEHYLAHHYQKGLLGIVQGFKSELTLVGLIGLTLFIVNSTSEVLQGSEEVIEGVHFLMFFFVIVYFFVLVFSLIVMKTFISRRFRNYERVHSETLLALVEGEDYKQRAKDMVKEIGADKRLYKQNYANYNIFRKFFFLSVKAKLPEEEFAFFPFNEYMNLCMNDLMGRISSGTWIIWIAFAFFFIMDVYLKAYFGSTISRVSVIMLTGVTNIFVFIPKSRMRAFNTQKQPAININEENVQLLHENPQEVRITRAYQKFFACGKPKALEILTQIALWFSILNAFAVVFNNDASWPLLVIAILLALFNGAYIIGQMGPAMAGVLYNGPNVNIQFVKEVLKRHPRADKLAIFNEYVNRKRSAKASADELQDVVQE
jgi:ABC-type multidrug transport system fused ATPase/permease subunit